MDRPDDNQEIIHIEDYVKFEDNQEIHIICELCQGMKMLLYKCYKEQTLDINNSELLFNECLQQMKEVMRTRCGDCNDIQSFVILVK